MVVCAVRGCENKQKTHSIVMFHRFPANHRRRRAWLSALDMDPATPAEQLRLRRVCSEHFTEDDYYRCTGDSLRLRDTAIPTARKARVQQRGPSISAEVMDYLLRALPRQEESEAAPRSTTQKQRDEATFQVHVHSRSADPSQSTSSAFVLGPAWTRPAEPPAVEASETDTSETSESDAADSSVTSSSGSSGSFSELRGRCEERRWIVNESKLLELFQSCPRCGAPMCDRSLAPGSSRLSVTWRCGGGHVGQWESCPSVRGMSENDLFTAAATLFTGATHAAVAAWARLVNLQLPRESTFNHIQATDLLPAIEEAYIEQEDMVKADLIYRPEYGGGVHLCGDHRRDGGFNTYSFMDDASSRIVAFELTQTSPASSSVTVEPLDFRDGLEKILSDGIDVRVVTTDGRPSVRKVMRDEHPGILHRRHPWHVAKRFKKKLVALSKRKKYKALAPWVESVYNHLWWSCCSSKGDAQELLRRWRSVLRHVTGIHRWKHNGTKLTCFHKELSAREQKRRRWLSVNSPSFKALKSVIMDTQLQRDLKQTAIFGQTGQLEVFHKTLLKYRPERLQFQYPAMRARTMLAIMDHNENHATDRPQAPAAGGVPRHSVFQKNQRWTARPDARTTQTFRDDLMGRVTQRLYSSHMF